MNVLLKNPGLVVWIYSVHVENSKLVSIMVGLSDKQILELSLADSSVEGAVLAAAAACAPHALVGYSAEREEQFKKSPAALLQRTQQQAA